MSDKGIQIIVALLEKRESFQLTKYTDKQLTQELLRAESLGYVQKEQKSSLYTLSEKGRMLVYSNYQQEDIVPPSAPAIITHPAVPPPVPEAAVTAVNSYGDLRRAYTSAFLITAFFLLTILVLWLRGLI